VTIFDKNYSDQALNISFFAYRFNMNSAYIGRRFKEVMGFGLLEYIHKRRIEEAQRLIDSGLKLKDVAERVGFSNTLTMRRAFERYKKDSSINEIETEKDRTANVCRDYLA
jgi:AraC-like DNA-binding protein